MMDRKKSIKRKKPVNIGWRQRYRCAAEGCQLVALGGLIIKFGHSSEVLRLRLNIPKERNFLSNGKKSADIKRWPRDFIELCSIYYCTEVHQRICVGI